MSLATVGKIFAIIFVVALGVFGIMLLKDFSDERQLRKK